MAQRKIIAVKKGTSKKEPYTLTLSCDHQRRSVKRRKRGEFALCVQPGCKYED